MARERSLRLDRFAVQSLCERGEVLRKELLRSRSARDPEAVHDLRVAIRRLRACLEAFPSVFRSRRVDKLQRQLRRLFRLAGTVRDADIALEIQNGQGDPDRRLEKKRRRQARCLRKRLRKRKARKLLRRVRRVARRPKKDRRDAGAVAAAALDQRIGSLLAQGGQAVADEADPPTLHRLRIAIKKSRYAAEVFLPVSGPGAEVMLDELQEIQTRLGEIQDCATALALLSDDDQMARAAIEKRQDQLRREFFRHWRSRVEGPDGLGGGRLQSSSSADLAVAATASVAAT